MPMPDIAPDAQNFMGALMATGYLFKFIGLVEMSMGILILTGFYMPLALILIAPITLNIVLFHIFLEHTGLPLGIIMTVLNIFLLYSHLDKYKSFLSAK